MHHSSRLNTAVVIGAGIAGLLAARVLCRHAGQVVLLERDRIAAHPALPRKGVPQGHHAHALLASGQRAIESLWPGFADALREHGAAVGGGSFYTAGGYLDAPARDGSLFASRELLEWVLRQRLLALPNLRLVEAAQADALCAERGRVAGVHCSRLDGGGSFDIAAGLVIDAGGRGSRLPAWLTALGYEAPPVDRVEVGMRYASRHLRRCAGDLGGRRFFSVSPSPTQTRACGVLAQEGERWIVTLIGYFDDQPPCDDAGFAAFARSLPCPEVAELLARAEPLDAIRGYSFPANVRQRYERLDRFPDGLLAIGDALAAFSPVYGQGMSVAALQALALERCLASNAAQPLARRFYTAAARVTDAPWSITVGNDRQMAPGGPHGSALQRLRHAWVRQVLRAGHDDAQVAAAFLRVARLLDAPARLLAPALVARVLLRRWRQARRAGGVSATAPAPDRAPARASTLRR
jgi:2-polyprenyl-6-methoxyphenol hydroxylase-like FAD-dependent oxidoreductase